ncbi:MAG: endolytic transglycosylase MltG [Candidatus Levybacteria bacterium]|nr:endolytic transglycosylase MltG [Candidatus Levybacteria bacterium]
MKKLLTLFLVFVIFFLGLFFWWKNGLSAVNSADKTQKIFVIQKGEGVREIANKLKREGLIKDAVVFFIFVKKEGLDGKIQAGDFRLSPSMTAFDIAQTLTHGTLDVWVTIPEGKREITSRKNLQLFGRLINKVCLQIKLGYQKKRLSL